MTSPERYTFDHLAEEQRTYGMFGPYSAFQEPSKWEKVGQAASLVAVALICFGGLVWGAYELKLHALNDISWRDTFDTATKGYGLGVVGLIGLTSLGGVGVVFQKKPESRYTKKEEREKVIALLQNPRGLDALYTHLGSKYRVDELVQTGILTRREGVQLERLLDQICYTEREGERWEKAKDAWLHLCPTLNPSLEPKFDPDFTSTYEEDEREGLPLPERVILAYLPPEQTQYRSKFYGQGKAPDYTLVANRKTAIGKLYGYRYFSDLRANLSRHGGFASLVRSGILSPEEGDKIEALLIRPVTPEDPEYEAYRRFRLGTAIKEHVLERKWEALKPTLRPRLLPPNRTETQMHSFGE